MKALAPVQLPSMTTTQRDALPAVLRPAGAKIWNSTTGTEQIYDGSAWKDVGALPSGDWASMPVSAADDSLYLLNDTLGGFDIVDLAMQFKNVDATKPWEPITAGRKFSSVHKTPAATGSSYANIESILLPAAITIVGAIDGESYSSYVANVQAMAMGTTSAGTDVVNDSVGGAGGPYGLSAEGTSKDFAAASYLYLTYKIYLSTGVSILSYGNWLIEIIKMAGQAS